MEGRGEDQVAGRSPLRREGRLKVGGRELGSETRAKEGDGRIPYLGVQAKKGTKIKKKTVSYRKRKGEAEKRR